MAKRIRNTIIAVCVLIGMTTGSIAWGNYKAAVLDNSKTQPEPKETESYQAGIAPEMEQIAENEGYELYLNRQSLAIAVKEKKSGHILSSDIENPQGMNATWTNFIHSGITIEYNDIKNKTYRLPLTLSEAEIQYYEFQNGFQVKITYPQQISLKLEVRLEEDSVVVSVPAEEVEETGEFALQSVYVYPFLGASEGVSQPGYFFIPDGAGALIRTDRETIATEPYIKRVYGNDIGTKGAASSGNAMLAKDEELSLPVYGVISAVNQIGFAAIVEQGDAYAELQAYVSGIITPYNFITMRYIVRETYRQAVNQAGTALVVNQEARNDSDFVMRYTFVTEDAANYVGLSAVYREYLQQRSGEIIRETAGESIPMVVEFLAAELKKNLIGSSSEIMTTVKDMDAILRELAEHQTGNLTTIIRGYDKEGASAGAPTTMSFSKKVATEKEWTAYLKGWKELGIKTGFYVDVLKAYNDNGGYQKRKDIAQAENKSILRANDLGSFTYLSPKFARASLRKLQEKSRKLGADYLAVDSIGTNLYSNWNSYQKLTRQQTLALYQQMQEELEPMAIYRPNAYLLGSTSQYLDMPMGSSGYLIFTDTVPMLPMILKGWIPYYAGYLNFQADKTNDFLRMAEYGANLSVILTQEDPILLYDTPSRWVYTSAFEVWKEQIIEEYEQLNEVLAPAQGAWMTQHYVPALGIAIAGYSNGGAVAVNYLNSSYQAGSITLQPKSAVWVERYEDLIEKEGME